MKTDNLSLEDKKKVQYLLTEIRPVKKFVMNFDVGQGYVTKEVEVFETDKECERACKAKMKILAIYMHSIKDTLSPDNENGGKK